MKFSYSQNSASAGLTSDNRAAILCFVNTENKILGFNQDDKEENSAITEYLETIIAGNFLKKAQHSVFSGTLTQGKKTTSILVARSATNLNAEAFQAMAKALSARLIDSTQSHLHIELEGLALEDFSTTQALQYWTTQLVKSTYRFDELKTKKKPSVALEEITFHSSQSAEADTALVRGQAIAEGINLTRTLGNRPGNYCTPTHLADEALSIEKQSKIKTIIHEEEDMEALGMGALLSVSAGSYEPAKLIEMHYTGAAKDVAPIVLVGKGVTFDTGGISLKPPGTMDEMKFDMCGAATVFGVMQAVEAMQLPINLIGIVGAVENMPGGCATKPGDVVTSMSGKTIEVLNTDAEGRLVLCDALSFAQKDEPELMIDIATLTGACIVALGAHATGMYANRDELANGLLQAGSSTGDRAWRMPLWKEYTKQLDSPFADLGNIGGPKAGSVTAACFLQEFVGDTPWAHLDIAGVAWNSGAKKGATGRPVELLLEFLIQKSAA